MEELKAMYPVCTLIKSDGNRCGSPALTGANFCFQHIGGRIPKPKPESRGINTPIKFVYPSDHEAIQHSLFLVMQALSDGKIDNATASTYNRLLRSCELNLRRWQAAKLKSDQDAAEERMMLGAPHLEKMWEGAKRDCLDGQSSPFSDQTTTSDLSSRPESLRAGVPNPRGVRGLGWESNDEAERPGFALNGCHSEQAKRSEESAVPQPSHQSPEKTNINSDPQNPDRGSLNPGSYVSSATYVMKTGCQSRFASEIEAQRELHALRAGQLSAGDAQVPFRCDQVRT